MICDFVFVVLVFMRGVDIEKAKLVGARSVIGNRRLDRVTGIDQVDEIDTFDDPAIGHVKARDDTCFQHAAG